MIIALLAAVLTQDPGPSAAKDESLFGPEPAAERRQASYGCVRDGNTLEMNACIALDLEQEEARMQRYLAAAEARAAESDHPVESFGEATQSSAYLQASQAAWAAYAEIRCQGVYDQWKGGTVRTMMYVGCRIEATRARTHDIWSDYLTYVDSTPPVLPEPVEPVVHPAD